MRQSRSWQRTILFASIVVFLTMAPTLLGAGRKDTPRGSYGSTPSDVPGPTVVVNDAQGNQMLSITSAVRCNTPNGGCSGTTTPLYVYSYSIEILESLPGPVTVSIGGTFSSANSSNADLTYGIFTPSFGLGSDSSTTNQSTIQSCNQSAAPLTCLQLAVSFFGFDSSTPPGPLGFVLDPSYVGQGDVIVAYIESSNPPPCNPPIDDTTPQEVCVATGTLNPSSAGVGGGSPAFNPSGLPVMIPDVLPSATVSTAPGLSAILPTQAAATAASPPATTPILPKQAALALSITGANFAAGATTVQWTPGTLAGASCTANGSPEDLVTGFFSTTEVTAVVTADLLELPGCALISVANNTGGGASAVSTPLPLIITPAAPSVLATPSLAFGPQEQGIPSALQLSAVLLNAGGVPLTLGNSVVSNPQFGNVSDFCSSKTLPAEDYVDSSNTCNVELSFTPPSAGVFQAKLTFSNGSVIPLFGVGTSTSTVFTPNPVAFGSQLINTTSQPIYVAFTNASGTAFTISGVTISGANKGDFAVNAPPSSLLNNPCSNSPPFANGPDCAYAVVFTPAAAGPRIATLQINTSMSGTQPSVSLSGAGATPADAVISPPSLDFGSQLVGTSSQQQSVMLSNTGGFALTVSGIALTPAGQTDFSEQDNCKGASVPGGQSCSINITFTPSAPGNRGATLVITDNAASGTQQQVSLSGTGTASNSLIPVLQSLSQTHVPGGVGFTLTVNGSNFVSTSKINFGTKAESTQFVSSTQLSAAIPASDVATAGPVSITVTNPQTSGSPLQSAALTLTIDGYTVSGPATPPTVKPGQTASVQITVTATANGFPNAVLFSIASGTVPQGTLTFSQTSVTPNGGSATTTLMIATTAAGLTLPIQPTRRPWPATPLPLAELWIVVLLSAYIGSLLLPHGLWGRRHRITTGLFLAVAIATAVAACGGGPPPPVPPTPTGGNGTPAGQYPLVVAATSGSLSQTVSVKLTVQ